MSVHHPSVLLVGMSVTAASPLVQRLRERGCAWQLASSYREATGLLRAQDFDLVLSHMNLSDGSAYPLLALLEGQRTTLYFSVSVDESCWWLPALERGQTCWGAPALRPNEFARNLDALLEELGLVAAAP